MISYSKFCVNYWSLINYIFLMRLGTGIVMISYSNHLVSDIDPKQISNNFSAIRANWNRESGVIGLHLNIKSDHSCFLFFRGWSSGSFHDNLIYILCKLTLSAIQHDSKETCYSFHPCYHRTQAHGFPTPASALRHTARHPNQLEPPHSQWPRTSTVTSESTGSWLG